MGSMMGGAPGRPGAPGGSRGGMFGFGQSTARILKENTGVTFK
jgi:hypothetical protein